MTEKVPLSLTVNGKPHQAMVEPRMLLVDFLRHELGLTGTHVGCEQGVCGACTIQIDGHTARSCLHFAIQMQGANLTTIEGLAEEEQLHPIQESFRAHHALQCGYCTPGLLLTTEELLRSEPNPTREQVQAALTNNLCRCTGYVNIIDAVVACSQTEK